MSDTVHDVAALRAALLEDLRARSPKVDVALRGRGVRLLARRRTATRCASRASPTSRTRSRCPHPGRPARVPPRHALACAALLHDVVEDTAVTLADVEKQLRPRGGARWSTGVTKIGGLHFDSREARAGRELPQDAAVDGARPPRHPHQAGRPPAQHAHPRVPARPTSAQRIAQRDARHLRAARPPPRHRAASSGSSRTWPQGAGPGGLPRAGRSASRRGASEREAFLERGARSRCEERLAAAAIKAEVTGRPKHFYSIYRKMQRRARRSTRSTTCSGCASSPRHAQRLLPRARRRARPVHARCRTASRTTSPRPRATCTSRCTPPCSAPGGEMVEVQIRTREMHRTAENGIAAHYVYKEGGRVDEELDAQAGRVRRRRPPSGRRTASDDEYMEFLQHRPLPGRGLRLHAARRAQAAAQGRDAARLRLPRSTPRSGSALRGRAGQRRARAAALRAAERRHGRDHHLAAAQPHEDWLKIVRTAGGAQQDPPLAASSSATPTSIALGREMLERELKRLRRRAPATTALERGRAGARAARRRDAVRARSAEGQLLARPQVIRAARARPQARAWRERLAQGPRSRRSAIWRASRAGGVRIQGSTTSWCSFARCCQPVPGDAVVGHRHRGRGVSVHRRTARTRSATGCRAERRVAVEWDARPTRRSRCGSGLRRRTARRCSPTSPRRSRALKVNIRTRRHGERGPTARGVFVVEVPHLAQAAAR